MRLSGTCRAAVRILQELAPRCRMIIYTGDTATSEQLQMRARDRFGIRLLRCVTPPPVVRQALHLAVKTPTSEGSQQRRVTHTPSLMALAQPQRLCDAWVKVRRTIDPSTGRCFPVSPLARSET